MKTSKPLESLLSLEANRFPILVILTAQFLIFFFEWIALRLRPALLRSQPPSRMLLDCSRRQVANNEGYNLHGEEERRYHRISQQRLIGFLQAALVIFSGVGTPLGSGCHLRILPRSRPRVGARFGGRCTPLRLSSLTFAPVPRQPTPQTKQPQENSRLSLFSSISPCYSLSKSN
jgi:hypothetical protein